jgi:hypothetical protein
MPGVSPLSLGGRCIGLSRQLDQFPVRGRIALTLLKLLCQTAKPFHSVLMKPGEPPILQSCCGPHSLGDRSDSTKSIEDRTVDFQYPRDRQHVPVITELCPVVGTLQHDVYHRIIQVVFVECFVVTPFGDHAQLRVIFKIRWFLCDEVPHTKSR